MPSSLGPAWLDRDVACFAIAAVLVTVGTLATGFLPATLPYQLLAGGTILAGFVVIVVCLRDDAPE